MFSAMGDGRSTIRGLNPGDDVSRSARAVTQLGAHVGDIDSSVVQVEGWGSAPHEPAEIIDAGNSGTTARVLMGLVAGLPGTAVITGDDSLRNRPMLRVVAPLRSMGATIDGREHGDRLPVSIRGGALEGREHTLTIASAQVKTAVLLAGLSAHGRTVVTEPVTSRDHTERMLRAAGVTVESSGTTVAVQGGQRPTLMEWHVPGDISSAMYLVVAATLRSGSTLAIEGVGLNPTRTGALRVLEAMGASITTDAVDEVCGEPKGDLVIASAELHGTDVPSESIPSLIDEIPVLALAASQADGDTTFHGVGELRAKESNRLDAIVDGLRKLGGDAEAAGDDLIVRGPTPLVGGEVASGGDHRMAMTFAVAGIISDAPIRIHGWSCVETSFPTFLDVMGEAQGGAR
jgi:3-phosphoshikimate 1-carboxyvinyltransferase